MFAGAVVAGVHSYPKKPHKAISTNKIDTSKLLQTLQVIGLRYPNFFVGTKFSFLDSSVLQQYQQGSLANVLAEQSQVFIKSYGPGMLASPSFRGGNASQTAVLWNGFNLQSPMNGQVDFSLIPNFLMENIAIQYGSPASLFGSGNIGGAIHLQSNKNIPLGIHTETLLGTGSFGNRTAGAKIAYASKNWQLQEKVFVQDVANNYSYKAEELIQPGSQYTQNNSLPVLHATHAQYKSLAWIQEFQLKLGSYQKLGVKTWLQQNERLLPNFLHTAEKFATQADKTAKGIVDYQFKKGIYELQARYGYFYDFLQYQDINTPASIGEANKHQIYIDQFVYLEKYQWQISAMWQQTRAQLNQGFSNYLQQSGAVFSTLKWANNKKQIQQQISLRQEVLGMKLIPLMPSYGITWNLKKNWALQGNVARSYRLPSFNDLYWPAMGNAALLPEEGWNEELSITNNFTIKNFTAKSSLTAFNKNIQNWIIWVPNGSTLSTPKNIYQIWSRGLEADWKCKWKTKNIILAWGGLHDFTLATNEASKLQNDASLHQQLIYTPRLKHHLQFTVQYKTSTLQYGFHYIGTRFIASDASTWLNPYHYSSLSLSHNFNLNKTSIQIQLFVQNLFNQSYQIMANAPMPLANYQLSLKIKI